MLGDVVSCDGCACRGGHDITWQLAIAEVGEYPKMLVLREIPRRLDLVETNLLHCFRVDT